MGLSVGFGFFFLLILLLFSLLGKMLQLLRLKLTAVSYVPLQPMASLTPHAEQGGVLTHCRYQ